MLCILHIEGIQHTDPETFKVKSDIGIIIIHNIIKFLNSDYNKNFSFNIFHHIK